MVNLNSFLVSAFVILCAIDGGLFKQIPSYIQVCKRDQKTIDECARSSIESLKPKLIDGIPELEVPGIDPLIIPEVTGSNGAIAGLRASAKNLKVSGAGNFTIKSINVDLDTLTFRGRVRFPKLHFEGLYKLDAQLFVIPLKGQGNLIADAEKCIAELVLRAKLVEVGGVEYMKFTSAEIDINIKDYRIKLDGLFNGDKTLGNAANEAINQNRGEFLQSTKPHLERTVSKLLLDFANRVIEGLPFDELLPKP